MSEPDRPVLEMEMPPSAVWVRGCLRSTRELPESGDRLDAYRVGPSETVWWTGEAWSWLPKVQEPSFRILQELVFDLERRITELEARDA